MSTAVRAQAVAAEGPQPSRPRRTLVVHRLLSPRVRARLNLYRPSTRRWIAATRDDAVNLRGAPHEDFEAAIAEAKRRASR